MFGNHDAEDAPAAGAPASADYARALNTDFLENPKHASRWQEAEPEGLRSALRAGELLRAVIPGHWGLLIATDTRLLWIARGQVRSRCARGDVRFVEVTPGAKLGYELVLQDRNGNSLGLPTHRFEQLLEAQSFHRAVTPRAQPKVTLRPEDTPEDIELDATPTTELPGAGYKPRDDRAPGGSEWLAPGRRGSSTIGRPGRGRPR
jgi:hypothetical protein